MALDVHKLTTLHAVLAHGSFSAAARSMHLTQPAVSRQVGLLERQLGTPLVRRTQRGVVPTEAGRVLARHTEAILGRLASAEAEVAELTGLSRGTVRLGSFFTAMVHLSTDLAVVLGERHPGLVVADDLVDRVAAFRKLAAGALDLAIVFEHDFLPTPPATDVRIVPLFDDPVRVLLPADHRLARRARVALNDLAGETWIRSHDGTAAQLVDHVLAAGDLTPRVLLAGHGDEPIEAQALVLARKGVTVAHELNVIPSPDRVAVRRLTAYSGVRRVQAAIAHHQDSPTVLAALDALREVGRRRRRST